MRRAALLLTLLAGLAGCASPASPTASPLRLPTRLPPTPTPTVSPLTAQSHYQTGLALQAAGDAAGAMECFTQAIELDPTLAPAYVARGTVYLGQGELQLALDDARVAVELDPENASAYALRGETLRLLGLPHLAAAAFERAGELDPALRSETYRSRWLVARATDDADRLLELSQEYAQAHPHDPARYYYRAWALIQQGEHRAAIYTVNHAIETTPDPPALLWFTLGHAYAADGSWQEALTSFEAARALVQAGDPSLSVHSDQPIAHLFGALGQSYLGVGRCVDAEVMLEYALEIGAPASEYGPILEEARLCQTPTPTSTPYPTTTPAR